MMPAVPAELGEPSDERRRRRGSRGGSRRSSPRIDRRRPPLPSAKNGRADQPDQRRTARCSRDPRRKPSAPPTSSTPNVWPVIGTGASRIGTGISGTSGAGRVTGRCDERAERRSGRRGGRRVPIRSPTPDRHEEVGDRDARARRPAAGSGGAWRVIIGRRRPPLPRTPVPCRGGSVAARASLPPALFVLDRRHDREPARQTGRIPRREPSRSPIPSRTATPIDAHGRSRISGPPPASTTRTRAGDQPGHDPEDRPDDAEDPGLDDDGPPDLAAGHPGRPQDAELADPLEDADRERVDDPERGDDDRDERQRVEQPEDLAEGVVDGARRRARAGSARGRARAASRVELRPGVGLAARRVADGEHVGARDAERSAVASGPADEDGLADRRRAASARRSPATRRSTTRPSPTASVSVDADRRARSARRALRGRIADAAGVERGRAPRPGRRRRTAAGRRRAGRAPTTAAASSPDAVRGRPRTSAIGLTRATPVDRRERRR